jgi:type II secretion system protein D
MQKVCKLALALLGLTCSVFAQDPATNANTTVQSAPGAQTAASQAQTAAEAQSQSARAERNIRFQFDGIPYMDLVERFAQMANKPLLAETNIQGTVTFNDPRPYNYAEALETLNTILSMKNVMVMETDRYLQVVPFKELPQMPLKIFRGLDNTGDVRGGEVVTIVLELKNLDAVETAKATSPMLSSAGSVAPLSRGKGLIITDRMENIRRIRQLLAEIDSSAPVERVMKTHTLLHASGAVVTDLINKTFGASTAPQNKVYNEQKKSYDVLPPEPATYVTAVFDEASKTLLLFGPGERVSLAEELIARFENNEGNRGGEVKIFHARSTKAEDLARMIRQAIPGVAGENETGAAAATKARVIVDSPKNRLIVTAPIAGQLNAIENLVNRVETGTSGTGSDTKSETVEITKVIRLNVADPATSFRVLTNAFTRRAPNGDMVQALKANLDPQTKTIVVTGSPGDVQHALGIVEQMEDIAPGAGPMQTEFLEFASASELKRVQPLIQQLYSNQVADGTPGVTAHAKFVPDLESKRLIVSASEKHIELIQKIADQLKSPSIATQPREFRSIILKNTKVDQSFKTISDLVLERMNDDTYLDIPKPLLLPDAPNNRLLITANAAQLKEIEDIVKAVDIAPATADRQFRAVQLYNRAPAEVVTLADQLYKEQLRGQPDPLGGAATFVAETKGNRVIVIGSEAETARAEKIIRQIDPEITRSASDETRVLRLRNAQASDLASLVEKSLNLQEAKVKLLVDPRSNAIVISGDAKGVESAANMIEQLDVLPNTQPREVRMIELKSAQAPTIVPMLTDLLTEVMRNLRGKDYVLQSRVMADPNGNRVIVTGTSEELQQLNSLVQRLDTAPEQTDGTRVFQINSMNASDMARIVSEAMINNRGGGGRRSRVSVSPDDRSNNLVVTGDREDLQDVAVIIEKLDGGAKRSPREVRIVELQTDDPAKLVQVAQQVWTAQSQGRPGLNEVTLTLEPSGKRVILVAPANLLDQVEKVVTGLDQAPDGAPRSLQVVEIKSGTAATLLPTLSRLYEEQEKGKKTRPATIVPEATGKRLMIYGSEEQVTAIRQIVEKLETGTRTSDQETRVYNLNSTTADDLVTMVRSVYQQEIKKHPEISSSQALILPDALSNRLIVSGSVDELNIIEGVINKLDQVSTQTGNTRTFELKNAQAEQVATLLSTTLTRFVPGAGRAIPRVTVGIDTNNNTLIVSGQPADLAAASTIIEKLDSNAAGSNKQLRIFPIHGGNTADFASRLRQLYNDQVRSRPDNGPADALILPDLPTDRLIVTASEKQLPLLEKLVTELDALAAEGERQLRLFNLKYNSATSVSAIVREMFNRNVGHTDLAQRLVVTQGIDPNTLVAEGPKPILDRVAELIEQVDMQSHATTGRDTKILNLGSPEEVQRLSPLVQQLYREQLRGKEATDPADALFLPDSTGGRMIVTARTNHLAQIETILTQLRENTNALAPDHETRIFNLASSTATELAVTVNALYSEELKRNPGVGSRALILPDSIANRLILSGSSNQLASIENIIRDLDQVSPQTGGTRVFKLKASDAEHVASVLSTSLVEVNRNNNRTIPRVSVGADTNSNSLVVSGDAKDLNAAALIIEQLDNGTVRKDRQMRILSLQSGKAVELATKVRALYVDQVKSQPNLGPADALILGDPTSDRLILTASEPQLELLQKIVSQLDEIGTDENRQLAVRPLKSSSARSVAAILQQFFARQIASQDPSQRLLVSTSPDDRSLILEGNPDLLAKVDELAQTLESRFEQDNVVIQTVRLEKAQAENVAEAVNQTLAARGPGTAANRAKITPVSNSNALLIDGPAESVQDVIKVIKELDSESSGGDIEIRVYKLEHGKARELSLLINRMLESIVRETSRRPRGQGGQGGQGGQRGTTVVVSPDERTNSLIVSANRDHFKTIEQLLVTLDQNSAKADRNVRVVILKNARAFDVSSRLNLLFEDRPRGERPVIEADTFGNSITIIASKSDLAEAEAVIAELDQVSREQSIQVRMLVIDNLPAAQVAKMLQSLYSQMSGTEIQVVDRLQPPPPTDTNAPPAAPVEGAKQIVTLSVDPNANALLMSGPAHELDAINSLVNELMWSSLGNEAEFRQFTLKEADPVAVAKTLQELFKPEPIVRQPQQQGQQPQTVTPAPRMTIVAEPRTRSIIVRGKATDFILLESLLQQLDVQGAAAQLAFRLVKLEHATPDKILPLIQQMITQLGLTKPGDPVSVSADLRTGAIFAVARETMLDEVEKVIKGLDLPPAFAEAQVAMIALKNTVASQLATILQNMLKPSAAGETTPQGRELQEQIKSLRIKNDEGREVVLNLQQPIRVMADSNPGVRGGNRLIISSTADNITALTAVVEMMDTVALVDGVTFRIVKLENADATTVSATLTQIFAQGQRLAAGPAGPAEPASETGRALTAPLNIAPDQRSNSLILTGKPETIDLAERLLRDLDTESKGFVTEVKLFNLKYASAIRLAPLLQTVFTESAPIPGTEGLSLQVTRLQTLVGTNTVDGKTSLQPKVRSALTIQADDPSNTLVVAARADIMPLIEDVIKSMDIPAATGMDTVRIFPLKNADATRLRQMITDIYTARGSLMRPEEKPALTVDPRTNALIVSGGERAFSLIETLIMQLDMDLPFEFGEFRIIKLENADASVVAGTLQQIIDTRATQKAALTAQSQTSLRAIVIGDPRINSIIVGGSSEVFELVEALAKQLDQPGLSISGQIRLIPLEHANAGTLATSLNTLFTQRYSAQRDANAQRNRPIILPDPRINALLVSAGVEDNKALDELLKLLDQKLADPALVIEVIGLKENDATSVASMIQNVFTGRAQAMTLPGQIPNPQERVIISADTLSNALIVVANKENLELIRGLLEKVDVEPNLEGGMLQIITLKKADANRVASMLRGLISQGLYRPGITRGAAGRAREAMAIAVDTRSNTLIISASPENLAVIREVIERIDAEDYSLEGDIRLFTLRHARASNLAQTLQQFFNSKRQGESQGQENQRRVPVTILPDDRTNTLLVTGGREAFEAVERLIAQLDSVDVFDKMNFRVVTLRNSTATKLQGTLTRLFANRPPRTPGRPVEPITIVADQWANALVIGASVEDMEMVVNLISTIDTTQPENGMQVAVIPVLKGDATGIAQTIRSLYREGPNSPITVQVDVDERLNAIVVSAGEVDLKRIEELVAKLDTSNVARVSEIRVFPLRYAQADELSQVLTIAFTGRDLSPTGATTNPQRQSMLQFITRTPEGEELVAAALKESLLITADRRRNALVVSAPVDSMNLLARVIENLDSEAPQLAKIRVFKLTNADARQMADVLTSLFRLRQQPGVPPNQRAIQYTLVRDVAAGDIASGEPFTATIGSAEQYALTVTIDLRTNSLLLGGTDHYVGLAAHIIEELDSSPALERRTEVIRLKNARAREVETALRSFVDQERQRTTMVQGETLGAGAGPASGQAVGSALIGETVQQLLEKEVAVVADTNSNTLLISASPRYFTRFEQIIGELDEPLAQVLIQVILAEVTLDKTSELGVEWTVQGRRGNTDFAAGTDFGVVNDITQFGGFSSAITGSDVGFVLRALEADGRLEVLSRPQILTADNQEASIDIGQRVPLPRDTRVGESQLSTITTYEYEDVGVNLTVTPRISPDGSVRMEVAPTISQLSSSDVQIGKDIRSPIINQRKATTTVSVQNGESVIIGGLISTSDDRRRAKVPFLGNIPYIGALFRSSRSVSDRKELLIILTPQLLLSKDKGGTIDGLSDAQRMTRDQLQRSTIKDEIRRDKLQQEILEPILPFFDKPLPPSTNTLVQPPKA